MNFGTGWLGASLSSLDMFHASDAHVSAALERAGSVPDEGGVKRAPWVVQQRDNQSCVGEGCVRFGYAFTGVKASSQIPWLAARALDAPGSPLRNVGVSMRAGLRAMAKDGACPLDKYDPGPYGPLDEPPDHAYIRAQALNLDTIQVYADGMGRVIAMVDALHQGLPCGIAIRADATYENPAPDGFVGPEDGSGRLHFVVLWAYRTQDGHREFLSPSSWGEGHGPGGLIWLHESRIANSYFAGFCRGAS